MPCCRQAFLYKCIARAFSIFMVALAGVLGMFISMKNYGRTCYKYRTGIKMKV